MVSVNEKFGTPRSSVTGTMLQSQRYTDKHVRLIGSVVKNNRDSIEVNSGDNVPVTIRFKTPIDEPIEGIIDIQGRVISKNVIESDSYIILPPELASTFDLKMHNEAITFIASSDNPWSQAE